MHAGTLAPILLSSLWKSKALGAEPDLRQVFWLSTALDTGTQGKVPGTHPSWDTR